MGSCLHCIDLWLKAWSRHSRGCRGWASLETTANFRMTQCRKILDFRRPWIMNGGPTARLGYHQTRSRRHQSALHHGGGKWSHTGTSQTVSPEMEIKIVRSKIGRTWPNHVQPESGIESTNEWHLLDQQTKMIFDMKLEVKQLDLDWSKTKWDWTLRKQSRPWEILIVQCWLNHVEPTQHGIDRLTIDSNNWEMSGLLLIAGGSSFQTSICTCDFQDMI